MNEADTFLRDRLATSTEAPEGNPTEMRQVMVSMKTAWINYWTRWTFNGRASRSEYWFMVLAFVLINFVGSFILGIVDTVAFGHQLLTLIFRIVLTVATLVPGWCIWVRRLHDIGYNGWYAVVALVMWVIGIPLSLTILSRTTAGIAIIIIAFIYGIACLCWSVRRSDPKTNKYGPVPNLKPVRK